MTSDQVILAANGRIAGSVVRGVSAQGLFNNATVTNNVIVGNVKIFD
nr:hypothetical protein [Wolbachia endosymbiont of Atemnus politus]